MVRHPIEVQAAVRDVIVKAPQTNQQLWRIIIHVENTNMSVFFYWSCMIDLKLKRHERSGCCFPISSRSKNERHFLLVYVAPDFTCLGAVL